MSKFNRGRLAVASTLAGLSALPLTVHAAVPASVTTALEGMADDALAVAALVLVAIIAVAAFKFMRKGI